MNKIISNVQLRNIMILGFLISGCSSTSELFRDIILTEPVVVDYTIIYYIHADSDYLYHDSNGVSVIGNSNVLKTAHEVAEGAKSGEVFIFYQRPEKKFMGLFPLKNSQLYYYRSGVLTNVLVYRHSNRIEDFLTTEAQLYHQYSIYSKNEDQRDHFLYFGHEIPLENGKKYHRTLPKMDVNIESFSKGLRKFLAEDGQRFDLVVLSTCNNGTPLMAELLMPISDTVIASPQNLHLSHLDSGSLGYLEEVPEISPTRLAEMMAEKTYNRLESEILTAITITVYDFKKVRGYSDELYTFRRIHSNPENRSLYADNMDCKEMEFFDGKRFSNGIMTWYHPARFGRRTLIETHSGWGCKPLIQN